MADEKRSFDPSETETNRSRRRGSDPAGNPGSVEAIGDDSLEDWGEPPGEGVQHGADHATRGEKTDMERGPGPKTRAANKDQISGRT